MRDKARFEQLFAEHADAVHRFVVRRTPGDADDIVAETFLIAWRKLDAVPDDAAPWLFTTARWVLRNSERSVRRRQRLIARQQHEPASTQPDPADAVTDQVIVQEALSSLSEADQEVLRLAEWDQLGAADAGRVLGCSASAFSVRLHRARKRFAAALNATALNVTVPRTRSGSGPELQQEA